MLLTVQSSIQNTSHLMLFIHSFLILKKNFPGTGIVKVDTVFILWFVFFVT